MKRYLEGGPAYCRLTYEPEDSDKSVSIWAEVGPVHDSVVGIVQDFYEVDERGYRVLDKDGVLDLILVQVSEYDTGTAVVKPAKLNLDTDKLERVRK